MTILVVGDSFSFGLELSDLPTRHLSWQGNKYFDTNTCELMHLDPSQLAWPALLGQKLCQPIENISLPGSSNDRIFRKAVTYSIIKNYDLIICAWTNVDRYDFSWGQHELQLSASNVMPNLPWFKDFVTDHHSSILMYQKWLSSVVCLQEFFKAKNQPYLFVNSFAPSVKFDTLDIDGHLLEVKTQIDHRHYVDWDSNFYKWCQDLPIGPGGHFLDEGHELVADRMYNIVIDKFPALRAGSGPVYNN